MLTKAYLQPNLMPVTHVGSEPSPLPGIENAYSHLSSFLLSKRRSSGVYRDQVSGLRKSCRVFAVDNQHHGPEANDAVARTTDGCFRVHEAGRIYIPSLYRACKTSGVNEYPFVLPRFNRTAGG
jgi:hypothetical protein